MISSEGKVLRKSIKEEKSEIKSETERDDGFFTFELGIRFTCTLTGLTLLH